MTASGGSSRWSNLAALALLLAPGVALAQEPPASERFRVVLDAGHGGADTGVEADGLSEKALTLELARRIAAGLAGLPGVEAVLTRQGDYALSADERRRIANRNLPGIFVSLHFAASPISLLSGTRIHLAGGSAGSHGLLIPLEQAHRQSSASSLRLASTLTESVRDFSPTARAQVALLDPAPLLGVLAPAVMIEADYLTAADAARWKSAATIDGFAASVVRGIDRFLAEGKNAAP